MPEDPSAEPVPLPPRPLVAAGRVAGLADRLHVWRADSRVGVAVLLLSAVVAGFAWYRIGLGDSAAPSSRSAPRRGAPAAATGDAPPPTRAARARIVVHVAGAVVHPGVVQLDSGARVVDAVAAAGGGLPQSDLDRLDLAAKLVDGQRIAVPKVGDALGGSTDAGAGPDKTQPLDLNTATAAQLEALPGVGPVLADAIIRERERQGGFHSVDELRRVRGIGDRRFADLKELVRV